MTKITAAGYIAYPVSADAICGIGMTVQEVLANVESEIGIKLVQHYSDPDADDHLPEVLHSDFVVMPATSALMVEALTMGGAIAWGNHQGIACTCKEEDAA